MEYYDLVAQARVMRDELLRQLGEHREVEEQMGAEVRELLNTYAEQLELLVLKNHDFSSALGGLSEQEIDREVAALRQKLEGTEHPGLRQEYEKSIAQLERQRRSVQELGHQREILGLRIQSAFTLLKQLQLDFVRLKNASSAADVQSLASLKSRSTEISDYLEGLEDLEESR
jgi:uncharacterized coiled-coil DUF342 family protein